MKLRDIIKYLNFDSKVIIYESGDFEMFEGDVMNIPWSCLDLDLDNDGDCEAICVDKDEFGRPRFVIYTIDCGEA